LAGETLPASSARGKDQSHQMATTIYHRKVGGRNQTLDTALRQIHTREIWGGLSANNQAAFAVKALRGPLPSNTDGVEFETDVAPTPGCSTPAEIFWYNDGTPGVSLASDGNHAAIPVKIRLVRYTQNNIPPVGIDWIP